MPDRNYTIVFQADTAGGLAGIGQVAAGLKALDAEVKGLGAATQALGQNFATMGDMAAGATGALGGATSKTQSFSMSLFELGKAFAVNAAFGQAIEVVGQFGEMATKARDRVKELAIETMDLRDKMRELANLKGADGPDNVVAAEAIQLGMEAGLLPQEAVKYLEQFEGSSPAGFEKGNIDEKTKKALAIEGAKFGSRVNLAPGTAGDLTGIVSQYTDLVHDKDGKELPQDKRVEKAMAQIGRVAYGLNAGRGNLEPLVRSLANTAGEVVSMGGPMEDLAELAAIQGVASTHSNPRESGTRTRQAVRALRDTTGPAAMYMEQVGIKDGMTHMQRLERLKPGVDAAEKAGMGGDVFLKRQGFTDNDEVRALVEQVHDYDIIRKRLAASAKVGGREVMEQDQRFLTKERVGIRRRQKATKAGQEFLIGEENERAELAKETAEQELKDEHKVGGTWNNTLEMGADIFKWFGEESTRERTKYDRAARDLLAEGKKKGLTDQDFVKSYRGWIKEHGWSDKAIDEGQLTADQVLDMGGESRARVAGFNDFATKVERSQGNITGPGPNLEPKFDALIRQQEETNRILRAQAKPGGAPAPAAQAPGVPPMRAAAMPKRP